MCMCILHMFVCMGETIAHWFGVLQWSENINIWDLDGRGWKFGVISLGKKLTHICLDSGV